MVRLSVSVPEETWRHLRDLAESDRAMAGRASVTAVVAKIIDREMRWAQERTQVSAEVGSHA